MISDTAQQTRSRVVMQICSFLPMFTGSITATLALARWMTC
ncbi:hypothetical protein [Vibrio vulnificus]|nr:hypothetical protein [Vibrio vulnificus]